jgi:hypothetical protein
VEIMGVKFSHKLEVLLPRILLNRNFLKENWQYPFTGWENFGAKTFSKLLLGQCGDIMIPETLYPHTPPVSPPTFKDGGKNPSNVHSGGQVTSMKWRRYFTSVTGKIN